MTGTTSTNASGRQRLMAALTGLSVLALVLCGCSGSNSPANPAYTISHFIPGSAACGLVNAARLPQLLVGQSASSAVSMTPTNNGCSFNWGLDQSLKLQDQTGAPTTVNPKGKTSTPPTWFQFYTMYGEYATAGDAPNMNSDYDITTNFLRVFTATPVQDIDQTYEGLHEIDVVGYTYAGQIMSMQVIVPMTDTTQWAINLLGRVAMLTWDNPVYSGNATPRMQVSGKLACTLFIASGAAELFAYKNVINVPTMHSVGNTCAIAWPLGQRLTLSFQPANNATDWQNFFQMMNQYPAADNPTLNQTFSPGVFRSFIANPAPSYTEQIGGARPIDAVGALTAGQILSLHIVAPATNTTQWAFHILGLIAALPFSNATNAR